MEMGFQRYELQVYFGHYFRSLFLYTTLDYNIKTANIVWIPLMPLGYDFTNLWRFAGCLALRH